MAVNPDTQAAPQSAASVSPNDTTTLMQQLSAIVGDTVAAAASNTQATADAAEASFEAAKAGTIDPILAQAAAGAGGGGANAELASPVTLEQTQASRAGAGNALKSLDASVAAIQQATAASRKKMELTSASIDAHTAAKVTDVTAMEKVEQAKLKHASTIDERTAADLKALQDAHAKSQVATARLQTAIAERKMFTLGLDVNGKPLTGAKKAQFIVTSLFGFDQMNALSQQANQDLVTSMAYTNQLEQEINTKFSQAALEKDLMTAEESKAQMVQITTGAELLKKLTVVQGFSAQTELATSIVGMHKEDAAALLNRYNANAELYKTDIASWQALYQFHQARSLAREIKSKDTLLAEINATSERDRAAGGPGMTKADQIVLANALWGVTNMDQYMGVNPTGGPANISKVLNGLYFSTKVVKQDPAVQYQLAMANPGDPVSQSVTRTYENYLAQPEVQNSIQVEVARAAGAVVKDPKTGIESINTAGLQEFLGTPAGQNAFERAKVNALRTIDVPKANAENFYQSGGMVISPQDLKKDFTPEETEVIYKYVPQAWITGTATSQPETQKAMGQFMTNLNDAQVKNQMSAKLIMRVLVWTANAANTRTQLYARKNLSHLNANSTDTTRFNLPFQIKGPGGLLHTLNLNKPEDMLFLYNTASKSSFWTQAIDFRGGNQKLPTP